MSLTEIASAAEELYFKVTLRRAKFSLADMQIVQKSLHKKSVLYKQVGQIKGIFLNGSGLVDIYALICKEHVLKELPYLKRWLHKKFREESGGLDYLFSEVICIPGILSTVKDRILRDLYRLHTETYLQGKENRKQPPQMYKR
jgi:hypothetical protein